MMPELDTIRDKLFTSVLSDCLDAVGVTNQALPSRIRPLDETCVMVGRARTLRFLPARAATDVADEARAAARQPASARPVGQLRPVPPRPQ